MCSIELKTQIISQIVPMFFYQWKTHHFRSPSVGGIESTRHYVMLELGAGYGRVIFLVPWQLEQLEDKVCDVFINIYSFQEMTPDRVENYFSLMDRKTSGYLYLKQHYEEHNTVDNVVMRLREYSYRPHWELLLD